MKKNLNNIKEFIQKNKTGIIATGIAVYLVVLHSKRHDKHVIQKYMLTAKPSLERTGETTYDLIVAGKDGLNFALGLRYHP